MWPSPEASTCATPAATTPTTAVTRRPCRCPRSTGARHPGTTCSCSCGVRWSGCSTSCSASGGRTRARSTPTTRSPISRTGSGASTSSPTRCRSSRRTRRRRGRVRCRYCAPTRPSGRRRRTPPPASGRSPAGTAKAFRRARRLIYLEDQYMWSPHIARLLADALAAAPDLHIVVVVPRYPDVDGRFALPPNEVGRLEAIQVVSKVAPDRVHVFDLENRVGAPVYVHAKVCVIDDVWACTGSANLNRRSWSHDSELSCAVLDETPDEREPRDPAGLGDGARRFARDLRLRLLREHLDRPDDGSDGRRPARARRRRPRGAGRGRRPRRLARRAGASGRGRRAGCGRIGPRSSRCTPGSGRPRPTAWSTTRTGARFATASTTAGDAPARQLRDDQRRDRAARGATNRAPAQLSPDADVRRLRQPRRRRGLGDLARLDVARTPRLGGEHPDHAVVGERADRVDEGVDEISVAFAPPQEHQVDDLVRIFVEQLVSAPLLDRVPHRLVDVGVPPDFLDDHPRLHAELARDVGPSPGIFRGSHACTPLPSQPTGSDPSPQPYRMRNPNMSPHRRATSVRRSRFTRHDRGRWHHPRTTAGRPVTGQRSTDGTRDRTKGDDRLPVIREGLAAHLPDTDPDETAEWLESFDAVLDAGGQPARPLPDAADAAARPRAARRHSVADQHRLRQHHPHGPRAVVPRRRGGRARVPPVDPLERRDHGAPRAAAGHRRRRAHLVLRVVGDALRGRVQPLLPRQGPPGRRRPGVHPGARVPRRLRPRLPRGAAGPKIGSTASARSSRTVAPATGCRATRTRG